MGMLSKISIIIIAFCSLWAISIDCGKPLGRRIDPNDLPFILRSNVILDNTFSMQRSLLGLWNGLAPIHKESHIELLRDVGLLPANYSLPTGASSEEGPYANQSFGYTAGFDTLVRRGDCRVSRISGADFEVDPIKEDTVLSRRIDSDEESESSDDKETTIMSECRVMSIDNVTLVLFNETLAHCPIDFVLAFPLESITRETKEGERNTPMDNWLLKNNEYVTVSQVLSPRQFPPMDATKIWRFVTEAAEEIFAAYI